MKGVGERLAFGCFCGDTETVQLGSGATDAVVLFQDTLVLTRLRTVVSSTDEESELSLSFCEVFTQGSLLISRSLPLHFPTAFQT